MRIDYLKSSDLLKAIGHPIRLRILEGLMKNECNVNKIVRTLNVPQSTVSQHLGVLRIRGIIRARKEGAKTCYGIIENKARKIIKVLMF